MGLVAFVGVAKLTVNLGGELWGRGESKSVWGAESPAGVVGTHHSRWGPWWMRSACC